MLYVDVKEHRLNFAGGTSSMEKGSSTIQLDKKEANKPNKKGCC